MGNHPHTPWSLPVQPQGKPRNLPVVPSARCAHGEQQLARSRTQKLRRKARPALAPHPGKYTACPSLTRGWCRYLPGPEGPEYGITGLQIEI